MHLTYPRSQAPFQAFQLPFFNIHIIYSWDKAVLIHVRWVDLHDALWCLILDVVHDVGDGVPGKTGRGVEQVHDIVNGEGGV